MHKRENEDEETHARTFRRKDDKSAARPGVLGRQLVCESRATLRKLFTHGISVASPLYDEAGDQSTLMLLHMHQCEQGLVFFSLV